AVKVRSRGASVLSLALQPDGKILVGIAYPSSVSIAEPLLVRLNSDGSLDSPVQVTINALDSTQISGIAVQPDGRIVIGGKFRYKDSTDATRFNLARLNSDGSLDSSFVLAGSPNDAVNNVLLQPDGKIIIGGNFTDDSVGFPRRAIARLNSNGSLDGSFNASLGIPSFVRGLSLQPDGKLVVAGLLNF